MWFTPFTIVSLCLWPMVCLAKSVTPTKTTVATLIAIKDDPSVALTSVYQPLVLNDINKALKSEGLFIETGELRTAQMGNMLSTYFEALACSDITGIHFVHRRPPIKGDEQAIKFFSAFPTVRVHPDPSATNFFFLGNTWRKTCPAIWPHPHTWAGAWNQRPALIADVIHTAVKAVFEDVKTATIPVESFTHIVPSKAGGTHLPLVPNAAIMFRCVDILHYVKGQPYGFLNFNVYTQLIPQNVSTIYVLSEPLTYMDHASSNQKNCKEIGDFLVTFLHTQFPSSTVALRRGFPIDSVAIMANTPLLISAPSTFALFPGIANRNKVYTSAGLLYFDTPYLGDNFKWITSPALIYPGSHVHVNREGAVKKLKAFTTPLEKEVVAAVGHTEKCSSSDNGKGKIPIL